MMSIESVLLVEPDGVEAAAAAALIRQTGREVVGPFHSLEDGLAAAGAKQFDLALLQWEFGDGTDATPLAEVVAAAGIPYAFIINPGDPVDPSLFPGVAYLRKPLNVPSLEAVISDIVAAERAAVSAADPARRAEVELIKRKIGETAANAGPQPDTVRPGNKGEAP